MAFLIALWSHVLVYICDRVYLNEGVDMSYRKLSSILKLAKLRPNDRMWFGRWVDGYRRFCGAGPNDLLDVGRASVIGFLRQQKAQGRQAWQRLQMIRAIQF